MKSISILSLLITLTLFLTLAAAKLEKPATAPATAPTPAPAQTNLIHKACENSTKKSLCYSVLNAVPTAKTATLKDLAFVALKTAAKTAVDTSAGIKSLLNKGSSENADFEDGLSSCADSYLDVVDQIEDSVEALVSKNIKNVNTWVKAAIADVITCDSYVQGQSGPVAKKLAEKNRVVQELCKNALEVVRVLNHNRNY